MTNEEKAIELVVQFQNCINNNVSIDAAVMACLMEMSEWKDKQMIEKACEFIAEYFYNHPHANMVCSDEFENVDDLLERFKKAMEEQL